MSTAVCIPVRGDGDGLVDTLRSIDRLTGPAPHVVVAVDGPDPGLEQVAVAHGVTPVVLAVPAGSYAARAAAVAALPEDVDVVLFTDAGCVVDPGWAEAHRRALASVDLSAGAVDVVSTGAPTPAGWLDATRNLRQERYVAEGWAATCNLGVRRAVFDAVAFDTGLTSGGDRTFGLAARAAGYTIAYTEAARVRHAARSTPAQVLAKARRVGRGVAGLPPAAQPAVLPRRRSVRDAAAEARRQGFSNPWWLARLAWLDRQRSRAFEAAIAAGPHHADLGWDVVVLLNTRWANLQGHRTRWKRVVESWVDAPGVVAVTVVDHPWTNPKRICLPGLARRTRSWHPGVTSIEAVLPLGARPAPWDRVAWSRAARALEGALPPRRGPRLVVSASPLWAPIVPLVAADRRAFDAVDDWVHLPQHADQRVRIERGYAGLGALDARSAVTAHLAATVADRCGAPVATIGNGVDVELPTGRRPDDLPAGPFAVYIGTVQSRVDLDLLEGVARALPHVPIVVVGPAGEVERARLQRSPLAWLGPVDAGRLPHVLHAATVGLLPHKPSALTASMDPMKLYEYLAAGLAVVATPSGAPADLSPRVVRVADLTGWVAAVAAAVAHGRYPDPDPCVVERTWAVVADELLDLYGGRRPAPDAPRTVHQPDAMRIR